MAFHRVRVRRSRAEWSELIAAHCASGLTVAAFCRRERLTEPTFRWWQSRLRESSRTELAAFVPVSVVGAGAPSDPGAAADAVELLFDGRERRARISRDCPAELAATVIAGLRGVDPCS